MLPCSRLQGCCLLPLCSCAQLLLQSSQLIAVCRIPLLHCVAHLREKKGGFVVRAQADE